MSDCIFCKLANKEIPTEFLYEDENVVAFNDLNPLTPVHVLVQRASLLTQNTLREVSLTDKARALP